MGATGRVDYGGANTPTMGFMYQKDMGGGYVIQKGAFNSTAQANGTEMVNVP